MDGNKLVVFESFAKKAAAKIEARKRLRTEKLYIGDLDETIEIRSVTDQEVLDCAEFSGDETRNDKYLVYMASKTLQALAAQMMEQGFIKEHLEVMDMFSAADRKALAKEILDFSGFNDKPTVEPIKELDEVKNSSEVAEMGICSATTLIEDTDRKNWNA